MKIITRSKAAALVSFSTNRVHALGTDWATGDPILPVTVDIRIPADNIDRLIDDARANDLDVIDYIASLLQKKIET